MWSLFRRKPQVSPFPLSDMKQKAEDRAEQDASAGTVNAATIDIPPSESLLKQEIETLYKPQHEHFSKEDFRLKSILQPLFHDLKYYYQQLIEIRGKLNGRPLQVYVPFLLYIAIIAFLVVTEFAFNFKVFSAVMRESVPAAAALAIGTTGAVLAMAHFAGFKIRHGRVVMGTVLIFISVLVIAVFAGVRIGDVQFEQYEQQGSGESFEDIQLNSPQTNSLDSTDINKDKGRVIFDYISNFNLVALFFLINLCFLIVGILCSFYSHDPDEDYGSVSRKFYKTLKKVSTIYNQRGDNTNCWRNTCREFAEQYQHIIDIYRTKVEQLVGQEIRYVREKLKVTKEDDRYLSLNLPEPEKLEEEVVMQEIQSIFENPLGTKSSQAKGTA